jgi:hypothetical protein
MIFVQQVSATTLQETKGAVPLSELDTIFGNIISIAIGIFFIMLIIGGFKYITAGGEPPQLESAKKTLTYAIAGLFLIALAYLILRFIAAFTGVESILNFQIYSTPQP